MRDGSAVDELRVDLDQALACEARNEILRAEAIYQAVLRRAPGQADASQRLAHLALRRGQAATAVNLLEFALRLQPAHPQLSIDLAVALANADDLPAAISSLQASLARTPDNPPAWLLLGQLQDSAGDRLDALKAWYQAITRAQRAGSWKDQETTPLHLLDAVVDAIAAVRQGRRELFFAVLDSARRQFGAEALTRVERALTGYLREWDSTPADPRQRPKFFFFPGLPNSPYHDPALQPWASQLIEAFPRIRADALRVLDEDRRLPNFIPADARVEDYVSGAGAAPSWEAFFFYRRGTRFAANHERCPATSAVLESIELCRIADQAPEILFSILKPGSHINPHHGVSNVRLVMHLPLSVPHSCALNLVDHGEHHWQEGRLVMFDDTYLHEAWNRSEETRIVLLMDCWNPHLTEAEKIAVKELIETISGLHESSWTRKPSAN
jgi:aspartate beta-hydroxylase